MNISHQLAHASGIWRDAPPASTEAIAALVAQAPIELPSSYLELLLVSNGGEGDLSVNPDWFSLWPAQDVMQHNESYQIAEYLPGFFGFGSNGGGELLAFDARHSKPWPIVMIPFIPMEVTEAVQISTGFDEFIFYIGEPENDR